LCRGESAIKAIKTKNTLEFEKLKERSILDKLGGTAEIFRPNVEIHLGDFLLPTALFISAFIN